MNLKAALIAGTMAFGLAGCMTSASTTAPAPMARMAVTTAQFVPAASVANTFEIQSSRVALMKSKNPQVRSFAQMMIHDHTAAGKKMVAAVRQGGMTPPRPGLDQSHQAMLADLRATPAADFDAAYINAQLGAHQEAVALFSSYASTGDNAPVVAFAQSTLPTLQMHLEHVQALAAGRTM